MKVYWKLMDVVLIFSLYRDKEDVVDREEDDTVEYSLRQVWHFNREKSVMSENVEIIAFHPAMIAIVLVVQRDRPASMGIISTYLQRVNRISIDTRHIFISIKIV